MTMPGEKEELKDFLDDTFKTMDAVLADQHPELTQREVGLVNYVGYGIVRVSGLPNIRSEEIVLFPKNVQGLVFNIDPEEIGVILLGASEHLNSGSEVRRTGRILDVPVGESLIGRVVDAIGRPLDNQGEIRAAKRLPVEREAPPVMARDPVTVPLQTGIKVIDALIPIGRGQRELIVGDRQTGKTAIALDTIINQRDKNVICIYCAIGKKSPPTWPRSSPTCRQHDAMKYTHRGGRRWEKTPRGCSSSRLTRRPPWGNTSCSKGQRRPDHLRRSAPSCAGLPGDVPAAAAAAGT